MEPLNPDEEESIIYNICDRLVLLFTIWKKPMKILATALGLVKRFYMKWNVIEMNPTKAIRSALIFAAKIEDHGINFSVVAKVSFDFFISR